MQTLKQMKMALEAINSSPTTLTIETPAEPRSLAVIRHALGTALTRAKVCQGDIYLLQLAVGEACANAIRHGSPDGGQNRMGVSLLFEEGKAVVIICDQGRGFDVGSVREPQFQDLSEGGMGIYLMRQIMGSVEFSPSPDGTTVVMTLQLKPPTP